MMEQRPHTQIEKDNPPLQTVEITDALCRENTQALILFFFHHAQELREHALHKTGNETVANAIIEDILTALLDSSFVIPQNQEIKNVLFEQVEKRIQEVRNPQESKKIRPELLERIIVETINPRLRMMLRLHAEGKTPEEIGAILFTRPETVQKWIAEATYSAN